MKWERRTKQSKAKVKSPVMCSIFRTVKYEVDWGLNHVGRQLDIKGMLWILQQGILTEAGQGTIQEVLTTL